MAVAQLIVIRTIDVARSLRFYEAIGCRFIREQHDGPAHYAQVTPGFTFEIYPAIPSNGSPDWRSGGATMLGFTVTSLKCVLRELAEQGVSVVRHSKPHATDPFVIVLDPDGRAVHLREVSAVHA